MTAKTLVRPDASEYAEYYGRYIARVPDGDVIAILEAQMQATARLLGGMTVEQGDYRYAPGKWQAKEIWVHVADAERVFAYRTLSFARGDPASLPGFDETVWAPNSGASARTLTSITEEVRTVRQASLVLARTLTDEQAVRRGTASGFGISVRALVYLMAGHELHHTAVLKERYLGQ